MCQCLCMCGQVCQNAVSVAVYRWINAYIQTTTVHCQLNVPMNTLKKSVTNENKIEKEIEKKKKQMEVIINNCVRKQQGRKMTKKFVKINKAAWCMAYADLRNARVNTKV